MSDIPKIPIPPTEKSVLGKIVSLFGGEKKDKDKDRARGPKKLWKRNRDGEKGSLSRDSESPHHRGDRFSPSDTKHDEDDSKGRYQGDQYARASSTGSGGYGSYPQQYQSQHQQPNGSADQSQMHYGMARRLSGSGSASGRPSASSSPSSPSDLPPSMNHSPSSRLYLPPPPHAQPQMYAPQKLPTPPLSRGTGLPPTGEQQQQQSYAPTPGGQPSSAMSLTLSSPGPGGYQQISPLINLIRADDYAAKSTPNFDSQGRGMTPRPDGNTSKMDTSHLEPLMPTPTEFKGVNESPDLPPVEEINTLKDALMTSPPVPPQGFRGQSERSHPHPGYISGHAHHSHTDAATRAAYSHPSPPLPQYGMSPGLGGGYSPSLGQAHKSYSPGLPLPPSSRLTQPSAGIRSNHPGYPAGTSPHGAGNAYSSSRPHQRFSPPLAGDQKTDADISRLSHMFLNAVLTPDGSSSTPGGSTSNASTPATGASSAKYGSPFSSANGHSPGLSGGTSPGLVQHPGMTLRLSGSTPTQQWLGNGVPPPQHYRSPVSPHLGMEGSSDHRMRAAPSSGVANGGVSPGLASGYPPHPHSHSQQYSSQQYRGSHGHAYPPHPSYPHHQQPKGYYPPPQQPYYQPAHHYGMHIQHMPPQGLSPQLYSPPVHGQIRGSTSSRGSSISPQLANGPVESGGGRVNPMMTHLPHHGRGKVVSRHGRSDDDSDSEGSESEYASTAGGHGHYRDGHTSSSYASHGTGGSGGAAGSQGERPKYSRKICTVPDCNNLSRSRGLCKSHGGGRRCSVAGCTKASQSGSLCISHGGGKRCDVPGCNRAAQSRGVCKAHGGGVRCTFPGCGKSSQGDGLCRTHGGGRRCDEPGCKKWAQRQGKCMVHSGEKRKTTGKSQTGQKKTTKNPIAAIATKTSPMESGDSSTEVESDGEAVNVVS